MRKLGMAAVAAAALVGGMGQVALASAQSSAAESPPGAAAHSPQVASATPTKWTRDQMLRAIPADTAPSTVRQLKTTPAGPGPRVGTPDRVGPQQLTPKGQAGATGAGPGFGSPAAPWYGSVTSPPAITSGRIFFTGADGGSYSCSGSTVNSAGKNLVFTAGHCVHGGKGGGWASNWVFVPRYNNGNAPYGTWSAQQLWSWTKWTQDGDRRYDFGVAVMRTDSVGRHIVNVVGGQGIEWNYPLAQYVYQFGYPSRAPFNGSTLQYCTGTTFNDGGNEGINCNMTEGASGGPWLDDLGGTFGWLDSVNSWVFWDANGVRYKWNGPYFGNELRDLYNTVANL